MEFTKYTVTAHVDVPLEIEEGRHPADLVRAVTEKLERGLSGYTESDPKEWERLPGGRLTDVLKVTGIVVRHANGAVVVTSGTGLEQSIKR
jgi:hypothetical protein